MGRDLGQHFVQPPLSRQICHLGEKLSQQGSVRNWPAWTIFKCLWIHRTVLIKERAAVFPRALIWGGLVEVVGGSFSDAGSLSTGLCLFGCVGT